MKIGRKHVSWSVFHPMVPAWMAAELVSVGLAGDMESLPSYSVPLVYGL